MTIDLQGECLLSLAEAAKKLPGRPHISTVHRWRQRGVRGIKLETVLIGGRRFTSDAALAEFVRSTTLAAHTGSSLEMESNVSRRRQQEIERAEKAFDEIK